MIKNDIKKLRNTRFINEKEIERLSKDIILLNSCIKCNLKGTCGRCRSKSDSSNTEISEILANKMTKENEGMHVGPSAHIQDNKLSRSNNITREDEGVQASSFVPHNREDEEGQASSSVSHTREDEGGQVASSVPLSPFNNTGNNMSETTLCPSQIEVATSAVIEISNESDGHESEESSKRLQETKIVEHISNKFDSDFDDETTSANIAANNVTIHNDTKITKNNIIIKS